MKDYGLYLLKELPLAVTPTSPNGCGSYNVIQIAELQPLAILVEAMGVVIQQHPHI